MGTSPPNTGDTTPQSEAVIKPDIKGDMSYFTQEVEYARQAINEMRIEMNRNASDIKAELTKPVDAFTKTTIEVNHKSELLVAEVKGQYALLESSAKHMTKSIDEMKPKIDTLTNWRLLLLGGSAVLVALFGLVIALWVRGIIKFNWPT